jgi:ABC-type Zn uptake system ZnuABC Zn-binding protein ZnuA
MNERIKELAKQTGIWFVTPREDLLSDFADQMAKKFDDILLLQYLDCIGNNDKKSAELIETIRNKTKTYFRVEE